MSETREHIDYGLGDRRAYCTKQHFQKNDVGNSRECAVLEPERCGILGRRILDYIQTLAHWLFSEKSGSLDLLRTRAASPSPVPPVGLVDPTNRLVSPCDDPGRGSARPR